VDAALGIGVKRDKPQRVDTAEQGEEHGEDANGGDYRCASGDDAGGSSRC